MTVSLSVIDHLGSGLYSSIPAVLSEAVANAWDADASQVSIDIDLDHSHIMIIDDGIGMDEEDIYEEYIRNWQKV